MEVYEVRRIREFREFFTTGVFFYWRSIQETTPCYTRRSDIYVNRRDEISLVITSAAERKTRQCGLWHLSMLNITTLLKALNS